MTPSEAPSIPTTRKEVAVYGVESRLRTTTTRPTVACKRVQREPQHVLARPVRRRTSVRTSLGTAATSSPMIGLLRVTLTRTEATRRPPSIIAQGVAKAKTRTSISGITASPTASTSIGSTTTTPTVPMLTGPFTPTTPNAAAKLGPHVDTRTPKRALIRTLPTMIPNAPSAVELTRASPFRRIRKTTRPYKRRWTPLTFLGGQLEKTTKGVPTWMANLKRTRAPSRTASTANTNAINAVLRVVRARLVLGTTSRITKTTFAMLLARKHHERHGIKRVFSASVRTIPRHP